MKDYTQEELVKTLENSILDITFIKVNGDHRFMKCTRDGTYIPKDEYPKNSDGDDSKPKREYPDDIVIVYDLENEGWRSFRFDSIVSIELAAV